MISFQTYQTESKKTRIYTDNGLWYTVLGLCGESGEVADKVKKLFRDKKGKVDQAWTEDIEKELGDILWYLAQLATDLGLSLEHIAEINLKKIGKRKKEGTLQGSGDNR